MAILREQGIVFILWLVAALAVPAAAQELRLSEEPYASGRILQGKYQPLLSYLQQHDLTASYLRTESYGQYVAHAGQQGIDIAFASPGLASLLANDFGYRVVLARDNQLNAVVVVRQDSNIHSLEQLANSFILVPEPYDIVTELGRRLVRSRGLEEKLGDRLVEAPKVDRILLSVMANEFDAGLVAGYDLSLLSPELRQRLRIIDSSDTVTAHYILLRKDLPAAQQQQIIENLKAFHESAEGAQYAKDFNSSRFVAINAAHRKELEAFRAFGEQIRTAK